MAHRTSVVCWLNHKADSHKCIPTFSGDERLKPGPSLRDTSHQAMSSVCGLLNTKSGIADLCAYVYMPNWFYWGQLVRRAARYRGFLRGRFAAFTTECEPYLHPGENSQSSNPAIICSPLLLPIDQRGRGANHRRPQAS